MKLLVMSDSHRNISRMLYASQQTMPDMIIHLGDHISDALELQRQFPDAIYYMVKGNCDAYEGGASELFLSLDGVRIFMTHGNSYGVKRGLGALSNEARRREADLALYGHTHQSLIRQMPGLWLMNPGQMERHGGVRIASYGIVSINGGKFECKIEYLPV